ncbi:RNA polymerase sigma factor [Cytophaga hutchinsonii]|uniref:RNA polymerase ECF-type sigma factor n=1 Tax=Cytophaga hutchinsonii (strain ATCC 33406 / DSM 1761 / CIP 103989 / NBRC 15051 / NCIMB 9469 / D465) TaxID=269798 RepID=A0A6N4SSY0_CYTH3|nr:RNA polymerase sigma factor [Cytophaga hutchinsonii]ABG59316.1 RNA polymerase ECF-type sigma factor [Cytophaga hutchinsonii ATCC 33406]SFX91736.1 RNA polymerase sigma factor, sigma-70 family [Cytophaga hutchinsonii ATCC 33406]
MKFSTPEIIYKIKTAQDKQVLNWLYDTVYPKVRRYVLGNNGSVDDSKDVFQEAVLVLYKQVIDNKYDLVKDTEGYVITISRNIWINTCRKTNRQLNIELAGNPVQAEDNALIKLIMTEKWDAFQRLFDMIGDRCKQLLLYSTYEKISMEEIAVKMNFTNANAAKTTNYRCKQKLIELVASNKDLANSLHP